MRRGSETKLIQVSHSIHVAQACNHYDTITGKYIETNRMNTTMPKMMGYDSVKKNTITV